MKEILGLTTKQPGNEGGREAGECRSGIQLSQLTLAATGERTARWDSHALPVSHENGTKRSRGRESGTKRYIRLRCEATARHGSGTACVGNQRVAKSVTPGFTCVSSRPKAKQAREGKIMADKIMLAEKRSQGNETAHLRLSGAESANAPRWGAAGCSFEPTHVGCYRESAGCGRVLPDNAG